MPVAGVFEEGEVERCGNDGLGGKYLVRESSSTKQDFPLILSGLLSNRERRFVVPYSREYSEEKYLEIEKYLGQLAELEDGKVLSIPFESLEEAERLRWLFYDYFHLAQVSKSYKLALFNNLLLVGKKKPTLSNLTSVKEGGGVSKKLDSLIKELLTLPLPRVKIAELALDESISYTALGIVLGELGRVLGE